MKYFAYILCTIMIVGSIGCASLSSYLTPARLDPAAIQYVIDAMGEQEYKSFLYPNLNDLRRLQKDLTAARETNILAYQQMVEKDSLQWKIISETITSDVRIANDREEMLFSETGLLSMGLGMLGVGGIGGLLGLMRKRPQDWSPEEVESALEDVHTDVERSEEQIYELVRGVQDFIEADPNASKTLKKFLAQAQSAMTKETVAKIKSKL